MKESFEEKKKRAGKIMKRLSKTYPGAKCALDFSNPYQPEEISYYVPLPGKGQTTVQSNDVFRAENGLVYLIDRYDGLEILEPQV